MHKGLLSLWRSIFKEKCWDHFYILITEKDLIKFVLDIKIAWGWGWESFNQARGKSKKMCKFCQHFEVAFTKVDKCFCGSLMRPTPQAFDSSRKMVERKIQRRGLLCRSPIIPPFPTTSPVPSFPSSQDKSWTEAGSLPLADISSVPMVLMARWLLWPKFPISAFLLTCSPTGCLSSYVWGYHRVCCFTSNFKVWECASLQAPSQTRALCGLCIWRKPAHRALWPTGDSCCPSTDPARITWICPHCHPLSVDTLLISQTSCGWTFIQNEPRREGEPWRQHSWAHNHPLFGSVCRFNPRFWGPFLSDPAKCWNITLLPLPLRTSPYTVEEVFSLSKPQMLPIHCHWLDT